MSAHLFSESGQMQEVDIPDIFDVLEGGEDENAVKYLLGFGTDAEAAGLMSPGGGGGSTSDEDDDGSINEASQLTISIPTSSKSISQQLSGSSSSSPNVRKRDTSGLKAIYHCESCNKAFTTKFNLKRHINMHCHKSKEAGVPIQGPPSASMPSKKPIVHRVPKATSASPTLSHQTQPLSTRPPHHALPSTLTYQVGTGAATATVRVDGSSAANQISPQPHRTIIHQPPPSPSPSSLSLSPLGHSSVHLPEASLQIIQDLQPASASNSPICSSISKSSHQKPITVITTVSPGSSSCSLPSAVTSVEPVATYQSTNIPLLQTVSSHLQQLGMSSASFSVTVTHSGLLEPGSLCARSPVADVSVHLPTDLFENSQPFSPNSESGDHLVSTKTIVLKTIGSVPEGWLRKPVLGRSGEVAILYYNPSGRKFSSQPEVDQHFVRLGYAVCHGVFDFEVREEDKIAAAFSIATQKKVVVRAPAPFPTVLEKFVKMPPKRRLSATGVEEDDSRDGSEGRRSATPEQGRKRKKIDPQQQMQSLYEFLRRYKREDGSELCEPFIRAPKRRTDPAYFEVVSDPIDMLRIQQKLKTDEFASLEELKADFQKLIDNALAYYKEDTEENKAAKEMRELLDKALEKIEAGEDPTVALGNREESEENELTEMLEDLFAAVITAQDPNDMNRPLHTVFRLLPSQKRYPEYYEVIKDPVDLKMIATKIQNNEYESLIELEEDLNTMVRNAMHFNEPGSQIYKDAKMLLKLVKSKKYELEVNKVARDNRGSRSTRRLLGKKHYSAEISDLTYEDSESEDSEEEITDSTDPMWVLYGHVRHYETPSGISLAAPFLTLPSKREFPDYYMAVEEPISLNQIRKKLKSGEYATLTDLAEDLNNMFENCKLYNRPDSRVYKDGAKLQKIFQAKLEEIQMEDEDEEDAEVKAESVVKSPKSPRDPVKKRMRILYNSVLHHKNRDGVEIVGMFMEKPSRKDYPDYYEVITHPMDMNTINDRIKAGAYRNEEEFIQDMKLMFSNCRKYNEEGSAIYEDANVLERVMMNKAKDMGVVQPGKRGRKKSIKDLEKMKTLLETLRDHKDAKGRQLSIIFLKLPNPKEFHDYFEVIKNPVDFETVSTKLKQGRYSSLEDCLNDFILMFDNACKYNEPDSQIYKDALTLQNLAHRTCRNLLDDENSIPDVGAAVQELLSFIFISMYNHQDAEERCYSDSLAELPEHDEVDGKKVRALNLDLIKQKLDRNLYKRLDVFQRDIFAVLERARNLSPTDSQIFEDATELQMHFIRTRDEACGDGDVLQSTALMYTTADLMKSVELLRARKQESELPEVGPEQVDVEAVKKEEQDGSTTSATFNQQQYRVGEFVYTERPGKDDKDLDPSICLIENIYTSKDGQQMMYGNMFFRPVETFHVSSRKFLESEVFRTDVHESIPLSKIVGRCMVVPVRDYFRSRPVGFDPKDVFVCESRYQHKARSFKKIMKQVGFWPIPAHITMEPREVELEPKRVMSVFKERIERHKEELEEIEAMVNKVVDEDLPSNVLWDYEDGQQGCVYYEQYTIPGPITLRRGDFVYVRSENGKNLIAQIDTMWMAEDNMAYFHGPWYVTPKEMPPQSDHGKFYKQEACLSTISDSNPLLSVVGKCSVLELRDYQTLRPTQYAEADVYICESVYDESKRVVKGPLPNGMKQYEHSPAVMADEIYYFKNPIAVQKNEITPVPKAVKSQAVRKNSGATTTSNLTLLGESAPVVLPKVSMMDVDNEDSLDAPPSVGSVETIPSTPLQKKVKNPVKKNVTPYILYSSESRKLISELNKNCSFGEISRIVGDKRSKSRPRSGYQIFSSKVWVRVKSEMASGNFAEISREIGNQWRQLPDSEKQIYEEKAKRVNEENAVRFAEEQRHAEERRRQEASTISVAQNQQMRQMPTNGLVMTGGVGRQPSGGQGSPGGNHSPGSPGGPINRPPSQGMHMGKPIEPIFHTVPPRPQRLLHSEAYIRYIEGLTSDSQTMSNWEKQLNATKEKTRTDEAKLPAHWLADNGEHGTSLDALWALRDFMMADSLGLAKIL